MYQEPEIIALNRVYEALIGLNSIQVKRILDWVTSKFGLDGQAMDVAGQAVIPVPAGPAGPGWVEPVEPPAPPVGRKRRGRKAAETPASEETLPVRPVVSGISDFMKYESLEELFKNSKLTSLPSKVLLAAAFLQERLNFKELSSYEITSRFKEIGKPIKNASIAISSLMSRKPPLLMQTGTYGESQQSRKKFRVTEEGIKKARGFLSRG